MNSYYQHTLFVVCRSWSQPKKKTGRNGWWFNWANG